MRYFKFNNSRSDKHPFFVYVKAENSDIIEVNGSKWAGLPPQSIEISERDFKEVQESWDNTGDIKVGDEVVVMEYVSVKHRYGRVKSIDGGDFNIMSKVTLEDCRSYMGRFVRKKNFIHKI